MGNCIDKLKGKKKNKPVKLEEKSDATPNPEEKKSSLYANMSIFWSESVLAKIYGPEKAQEMQDKVIKKFSDASTAMRRYYKATGITLGEGAFGKVFLFESKQNPEEKYAVKVLLKSELSEQTIDICREEITILA